MKITVGQFRVKAKDIKHNFTQMENLIQEAIKSDYDLIVFGEYALSGYACADNFKQDAFFDELEDYTHELNKYSHQISIIFGSVTQDHNKHVSAVILDQGNINVSSKKNLNKREFNERDYFTSGENITLMIKDTEVHVTFESDYEYDNVKDYEKIIVLGSSSLNDTFNYHMHINEDKVVTNSHHRENTDGLDVTYANILGLSAINKSIFINGGNSYSKSGDRFFAFDKALNEGLLPGINEISFTSKLDALVFGIKEFSDTNFGINKKWIVGNSGGLDSAVTIALYTIALGKDNVISYNMRSKFNSDKTVNNANTLASKLGIKNVNGNIDHAVDAYIDTLNEYGYDDIPTLAYENIQARTRGHLLGGFSSLENAAISNNGNKMEIMLGYATLYGDTIGALASLGDLLKIEVFELAYEINDYLKDDVIPLNLLPEVDTSQSQYSYSFDMPPSAELKNDQIDPMKWYYHDYLLRKLFNFGRETVLEEYYMNQFENSVISRWLNFHGMDDGKAFVDDFNWFVRTLEINQFKRLQTPPTLVYHTQWVLNVDYKESSLLKPKSKREGELEQLIIEKYKN